MMISAGILGATGYTGAELLRLLVVHNNVDIRWITSEKFADEDIASVFPNLRNFIDIQTYSLRKSDKLDKVDVVFSCLPNTSSMHIVKRFLDKGSRVVDLSPDFRYENIDVYKKVYGVKHPYPDLCRKSVYGIPELFRNRIEKAILVANPGCFSTSVLLGIAPLIKFNNIKTDFSAECKTGVSGGGRAPSLINQFSEANDTISIGSISGHVQKYEIEDKLQHLSGKKHRIIFTTVNANINRGILTTIISRLKKRLSVDEILNMYINFYTGKPFVRIYDNDILISTKNVRYTNYCDISIGMQEQHVICSVVLDNLGKGASAQAVQNMNIMFGLDEKAYLTNSGLYP